MTDGNLLHPDVKFLLILSLFVVALVTFFFAHSKRDWAFLAAAMGFTVGADYFLVIEFDYTWGVAVFCFVHAAYLLRTKGRRGWVYIGVALAAAGVLFFGATRVVQPRWLLLFASMYASLFAANVSACFLGKSELPKTNRRIMQAGLVLFVLCDINVLLVNLPHFLYLPGFTLGSYAWIWIFYLPAQGLLAVSGIRYPSRSGAEMRKKAAQA